MRALPDLPSNSFRQTPSSASETRPSRSGLSRSPSLANLSLSRNLPTRALVDALRLQ